MVEVLDLQVKQFLLHGIRFGRWLILRIAFLIVLAVLSLYIWWRFGDWQDRAVNDLSYVHEMILVHHPGAVDPENPDFLDTANRAYAQANKKAETASSPTDHHSALQAYANAFNDGHLNVFFFDNILGDLRSSNSQDVGAAGRADIREYASAIWISIPSFSERRTSIAELTLEIEERSEELRGQDLIVIDLRGNTGGDSSFATRIAVALWSKETYNDWVPVSAKAVDWRASRENALHVRKIARKHAKQKRTEYAAHWSKIADGISTAVDTGSSYYRQDIPERITTQTIPSPIAGQVVVITDEDCASACLDFMDRLMVFPNVLHVGEDTSSDTQYMDVRRVTLPSKTGILSLPLKVYRERLRPSGGAYVPESKVDTANIDLKKIQSILEARAAQSSE